MIQPGTIMELLVIKKVEFGIYLAESEASGDKVLLPKKQVKEDMGIGSYVTVFVYRDSEDRLIATTKTPALKLKEVALLKVKEMNKYGAFLDWGLEKDLFLPFKQMTYKLYAGDECLISLYVDKSNRLCATMKVYPYLLKDSPYKKDDKVEGLVYEISDNFGAFVAVDDKFSARIPKKELFGNIQAGNRLNARVVKVHEDGKLELSVREKAYIQIGEDAAKVLEIIESFDGVLPFTDKANPEVIKRETGMSKNEFKRAVGNLLKERKIVITETCIRKL